MATDEARVSRLILAHDAALEPQDLPALARDGRHVRVDYTASDHLIAAIAHAVHSHPEHSS